jgi:hypothetical protein
METKMFTVSKEKTPVLFQQSQEVQQFATQFNKLYTGQKSVEVRIAWGKLLEPLYQGLSGTTVNAKGETLSRNKAWIAVCAELSIPRATADGYRNEYITSLTYPEPIRKAAAEAGLNLALEHVQAAYGKMIAEGQTQTPNALEAAGIVAELEEAPDANKKPTTKKTNEEKLIAMFEELYAFTSDKKLDSGFIRFCMTQAMGKLNADGVLTWQQVAHKLGQDEATAKIGGSQANV